MTIPCFDSNCYCGHSHCSIVRISEWLLSGTWLSLQYELCHGLCHQSRRWRHCFPQNNMHLAHCMVSWLRRLQYTTFTWTLEDLLSQFAFFRRSLYKTCLNFVHGYNGTHDFPNDGLGTNSSLYSGKWGMYLHCHDQTMCYVWCPYFVWQFVTSHHYACMWLGRLL